MQDIPYFTDEVDVQDLHDLSTNIIDEAELSGIHCIEQYILNKEEIEAHKIKEGFVELSNKQEMNREMVVLSKMPVKISCGTRGVMLYNAIIL